MKLLDLSRRVKQQIAKTLKTSVKYLNKCRLFALSILSMNIFSLSSWVMLPSFGLVLDTNFIARQQEQASPKIDNLTQLVLDQKAIDRVGITFAPQQPQIKVVQSRAEAEAVKARFKTVSVSACHDVEVSDIQKRALAQKAARQYGLDWRIVEAVWQIESGKRWQTCVRSYAGAQGPMQFMPGTWRAYQVDGNGDGVANINEAEDAVFAGARYLAANGGTYDIDRALWHYNHAQWYVDKVKRLASSL